ncbi:MAG TPA: SUMF1/EgtB/PvdO family nonheme iron enzyme, partial [Polyangiaceae bacterium]
NVVWSEGNVTAFWLDDIEVTEASWQRCADAGICAVRLTPTNRTIEPGLPVVNVTPAQAQRYCAWQSGTLPRRDQWLLAAASASSRRFPWGQTGLVCRRATFGLVRGPCAEGGAFPDFSGSRPDGKSDIGFYDLVGNVAELVSAPDGSFEVRGGSFRSTHASELKTWSSLPYTEPRDDIGFRCAYSEEPTKRAGIVDADTQRR